MWSAQSNCNCVSFFYYLLNAVAVGITVSCYCVTVSLQSSHKMVLPCFSFFTIILIYLYPNNEETDSIVKLHMKQIDRSHLNSTNLNAS